MEKVELNGSQQWIAIRGQNVDNPVLLFLAGGPSGSELPSTRLHLAELEDHFVVVNWDQPGAAKSYSAVDIAGVLNDYMGRHAHGEGEDADILVDAINEPEYGLLDKVNWVRGLMDVFNAVYPQLEDLNFTAQAAELEVPVYFLVGRYDVNAMASLAERSYDVLDAPHKELIWFEKSGHPPLYSEASKVVDVMVNCIRGVENGRATTDHLFPAQHPQVHRSTGQRSGHHQPAAGGHGCAIGGKQEALAPGRCHRQADSWSYSGCAPI
jgi:pimeloyl-ACP methyl ester carboxylesterase